MSSNCNESSLADLLDDVYCIQFTDNTWREAQEAREEVRELLVKAYNLGKERSLK